MTAQDITSLLKSQGMGVQTQLDAQQTRAEMIAKYRRYAEGDHDARLTTEMLNMLSIRRDSGGVHPYNVNYMEVVIDTLVDRLNLTAVEGDNEAATTWAAEILEDQRIDALQLGIHEAAIRDGDTYLLVDYDNEEGKVRWTHEPAYDGNNGVMVFYETSWSRYPFMAVKIWRVKGVDDKLVERTRCNLYFKSKIERFVRDTLTDSTVAEWRPYNEDGFGETQVWLADCMPFIHYPNKSTRHSNHGTSELKNVIPLQDTLNATNVSMVSTSQLTGFPIRWAKGFAPPSGLSPGMWVTMGAEGVTTDQVVDLGVMAQGEILPFVQQATFTITQIATISRTPIPELMAADSGASGESLKQRESGLLGKIRRAHVSFGNSWEDALKVTAMVQTAYGGKPAPTYKSFSARWESGEVRNDTEVVDNAMKVAPKVGDKEFLRLIAPVFGYDEAKIEELLGEMEDQAAKDLEQMQEVMGGSPPAFGANPTRPKSNSPLMASANGAKNNG